MRGVSSTGGVCATATATAAGRHVISATPATAIPAPTSRGRTVATAGAAAIPTGAVAAARCTFDDGLADFEWRPFIAPRSSTTGGRTPGAASRRLEV